MKGHIMYYVYIVSCANVDFIKIGITNDPQRRLTELQANSPYVVSMALLIECMDSLAAQQTEKLLHELMRNSRSNGEWFLATAASAIHFARMLLSVSGRIKETLNNPVYPKVFSSVAKCKHCGWENRYESPRGATNALTAHNRGCKVLQSAN